MSSNQTTTVPEVVKYSTQLPPELIKWVKLQAIETEVKDYAVIQEALEAYKAQLQQRGPQPIALFDPAT